MKKYIPIIGFLILTGVMIFISCKKENAEEIPVDNTPALTFMTGAEYVSSNVTLEANTIFKVGILGSKNPNTNIDIATFKVVRDFNGIIEIVHENNNVGESYLSWESNEETNSEVGDEKWTFTIKDYTGFVKEISFVITTVEEGLLSPVILFIEDENYISGDVTLDANSVFKAGISALANSNTNESLKSFEVIRIFEHTQTTIVYEESDINSSDFSWQDSLITSPVAGDEIWIFTVTDQAGRKNEISFTVTTTDLPMYTPVFSPTYLIVQQGGIELLDFYITCVTDDWEMIKIVVTYPSGLGSDVYIGSGQVITVGSPFTFSNYFPKIGGTWTFNILGSIKSGVHLNESFTAVTSMVVTGTLPSTNWTGVVCDAVGDGISADNPSAIVPDPSGWAWGNKLLADNAGVPTINGDVYTWVWTSVILEADAGFKVRTENGEAPPSGGTNFDAGFGNLDVVNSSTHVVDAGGNLSVDLKGAYTITLVIDAANEDEKTITIVEN